MISLPTLSFSRPKINQNGAFYPSILSKESENNMTDSDNDVSLKVLSNYRGIYLAGNRARREDLNFVKDQIITVSEDEAIYLLRDSRATFEVLPADPPRPRPAIDFL